MRCDGYAAGIPLLRARGDWTSRPSGTAAAYAAATLDFGLSYEATVLDWLDHLPAAIAGAQVKGP